MTADQPSSTTAPYYSDDQVTLLLGDAREVLAEMPDGSVNCIVTSPPYYKVRDYGTAGQYGLESTPAEFVENLRVVFREALRVLSPDGTCWINIDDTRVAKDLCLIPERLLIGMQDDGWIVRSKAIWYAPNSMPESALDRPSHRYEHVTLLTRSPRYWFDLDPIREPVSASTAKYAALEAAGRAPRKVAPKRAAADSVYPGRPGHVQAIDEQGGHHHRFHPAGRNPGDVWSIATAKYPAAHFAVFPLELPTRCIKAGCKPGGTVLDPFSGSGTTGAAARDLGRKYIGIDLNAEYHDLAVPRFAQGVLDFGAAS